MVEPDDKLLGFGSPDTESAYDPYGSEPETQSRIEAPGLPNTPVPPREESDFNGFGVRIPEVFPLTVIDRSGDFPAELSEARNLQRLQRASVAGWIRRRSPNDRDVLGRHPQFYLRDRTGAFGA
jgi:hypothetical protein